MFPNINPTSTAAWTALENHFKLFEQVKMKDLFFNDPDRFSSFSTQFEDILFDYSKNIVTQNTIEVLLDLAVECQLGQAIEAMFTGEKINHTEDRAVLHTALRNFSNTGINVDGI